MKVAVLDLGTNTFNLIISERVGDTFKYLYNDKIAAKLGRGGIGRNIIAPDAFERGINAIAAHKKTIDQYEVQKVFAFGTSALRTAENAEEFINTLKLRFGIDVEIISGNREAELICKGVRHSVSFGDKRYLILDIGGGSNEFIITDNQKIYWKESFPLGIARLNERFNYSAPITADEITKAELFFEESLISLFKAYEIFKPELMVGASGSFDSFYSMIAASKEQPESKKASNKLNLTEYSNLHQRLIKTTREELSQINGLEAYRVEFIVMASVFVNYILKRLEVTELWQSVYALKEGAMLEALGIIG